MGRPDVIYFKQGGAGMQKRGLSQEGLKLIACISMLIDHIAAIIVLRFVQTATGETQEILREFYRFLRMMGRLAFPIYCFLLVEGAAHTHHPKGYCLRLLIAAVVAEIPFDLACFGDLTWKHQNVMITLLLGFLMLQLLQRLPVLPLKLMAVIPFALLAQGLHTDYGAKGILVIALFALTRELPYARAIQFVVLWQIFSPSHWMAFKWLHGISVAIKELAVIAVVPIALYSGRKITNSKAVQWAFYLFYPVHLSVLYLIDKLC